MPYDAPGRKQAFPAIGLAQQGDVGHKGLGVETEPRAQKTCPQRIGQQRHLGRRLSRRSPDDPVMRPPAESRQIEAECGRPDFPGQRKQVADSLRFDIAEKRHGQVDRLHASTPPAANPVQDFSLLGQLGRNRHTGPEGEEQARRSWAERILFYAQKEKLADVIVISIIGQMVGARRETMLIKAPDAWEEKLTFNVSLSPFDFAFT